MLTGDIRKKLERERQQALESRDPLAIRLAGERHKVISQVLSDKPDDAEIDPLSLTVDLTLATRALGHSRKQMRQLIHEGKIPAKKVDNKVQIPLDVLL